jgi:hypothetical protein
MKQSQERRAGCVGGALGLAKDYSSERKGEKKFGESLARAGKTTLRKGYKSRSSTKV